MARQAIVGKQKSTKSIKVRPWTYGQITRFKKKGESADSTLTRILVRFAQFEKQIVEEEKKLEEEDEMVFVKGVWSTDHSVTPNGAKVRIDTVPCGKPLLGGGVCSELKSIYLGFAGLDRKSVKCALWRCEHKMLLSEDRNGQKMKFDTPEKIVAVADEINRAAQEPGGKNERWMKIHSRMVKRFPDAGFTEELKPETRPGKGKIKEYRCSAKRLFERSMTEFSCGDVWDRSVGRDSANKSIVRIRHDYAQRHPSTPTKDYDDSECDCGHEKGGHDGRGFCTVCKKFCDQ